MHHLFGSRYAFQPTCAGIPMAQMRSTPLPQTRRSGQGEAPVRSYRGVSPGLHTWPGKRRVMVVTSIRKHRFQPSLAPLLCHSGNMKSTRAYPCRRTMAERRRSARPAMTSSAVSHLQYTSINRPDLLLSIPIHLITCAFLFLYTAAAGIGSSGFSPIFTLLLCFACFSATNTAG
ncbi:uncharacterized protein K489DRAFT_260982 [Dissoconium aciculare CBS 342.82]|uniref:Uncharacterized protein n=1 Tax=Dissoconium aciculare CBS 342.82 TaxID=1314786 RepID=A0A6J3LYV6_9PEZI|nr:uncharacterized protein K489DRAFT_260982 [Dissoconium aciculare CBS 342.82]KAF1820941.1 hypothetical protein K489DRAFT_260982 [Dissoconium aciculare CBS 342.82]